MTSDICSLTDENLRIGVDSNLQIMSKRIKTGIKFNVRLLDIPKMILDKYDGHQEYSKPLPIISNQNMNEYLKEIADICNIKKKITCHITRHN